MGNMKSCITILWMKFVCSKGNLIGKNDSIKHDMFKSLVLM